MAHRIADGVLGLDPTILQERTARGPGAYQEMTLVQLGDAIKPQGPFPADKYVYFTLNEPFKVVSMPMGANTSHKLTYQACDHTDIDGKECRYGVKHSNGQSTCRSPEQHTVHRTRTRFSVDVVVSEVDNPRTQITFSFGHDVVQNVILKKGPQQVGFLSAPTSSHHPFTRLPAPLTHLLSLPPLPTV